MYNTSLVYKPVTSRLKTETALLKTDDTKVHV